MPLRPEDITLRAATLADIDQINWLEEVCMRHLAEVLWGEWRPSETINLSSHEMIENRGVVIGCMATHAAPDALYLTRLYLSPEARNQGIGATCLTQVLTRAQNAPVRLRVLVNNRAVRFYERHGFVAKSRTDTHIQMIKRNPTNREVAP
jgi:ribosomal protein S18 acetylase RimI-like enzyme